MGDSSTPPIPAEATTREGTFRKVKASFQDGILEEYGSVKFSEVGDEDPLIYAYSRRAKAILQAKALRHLDKTLGFAPHVYANKSTLSTKERRKRANRLAYENGVIGNRAVQQCLRDLFIGYHIRHASQEVMLGRIQKANAQLEEKITALMDKKSYTGSIQNDQVGPAHIHPSHIGSSQAFDQGHYMVQESFTGEMKLGIGSSFLHQNACPIQRKPVCPGGSDHTNEIDGLTLQTGRNRSIIPYEPQILFSSQNQLHQQQTTDPLNNQPAGGSQSHHQHLSQHKQDHQQEISSMSNYGAFFSLPQPHHTPLNQLGSIQRDALSINQWSQCFFPQDQTPIIPPPCSSNQDQHEQTQIVELGRQNGFGSGIGHDFHPHCYFEFGQHMSVAENMNGEGDCMALAEIPVPQNGHTQIVESKWNT